MMPLSEPISCRPGCGACCIAPSISSPIPGMPDGKPAGVRCAQLDVRNGCKIFGQPERPKVCGGLQPSHEMCGDSSGQAMFFLSELERLTA
jgi:Fe-S-cluster containining protein